MDRNVLRFIIILPSANCIQLLKGIFFCVGNWKPLRRLLEKIIDSLVWADRSHKCFMKPCRCLVIIQINSGGIESKTWALSSSDLRFLACFLRQVKMIFFFSTQQDRTPLVQLRQLPGWSDWLPHVKPHLMHLAEREVWMWISEATPGEWLTALSCRLKRKTSDFWQNAFTVLRQPWYEKCI